MKLIFTILALIALLIITLLLFTFLDKKGIKKYFSIIVLGDIAIIIGTVYWYLVTIK